MKKNLLSAITILATAITASAGTISFTATSKNGFDLNSEGADLPAGNLLRVGLFDIADADIIAHANDIPYLLSHFTALAVSTAGNQGGRIGEGAGNANGLFARNFNYSDSATVGGNLIAGSQLYVWALQSSNNTGGTDTTNSLATIQRHAIFSSSLASWTLPTTGQGLRTITLGSLTDAAGTSLLGTSKLLVGSLNPSGGNVALPSVTGTITLAPVPEPTSLAFIGLGAAGLLMRRRKKS